MMIEYIPVVAIVVVGMVVVWMGRYAHLERMEDKKIKLRMAETEKARTVKEEILANDVLVNRLMALMNIDDWRWTHKHDECRAELFTVVKAMLDSTGESSG